MDPAGLAVLRAHLDLFWERSLAAFQSHSRDLAHDPKGPADEHGPDPDD